MWTAIPIILLGLIGSAPKDMGDIGVFPKWSKVEIRLPGPQTSVTADPNPFEIEVEVIFRHESGEEFAVPAFYDGDGDGGYAGDVWKVRFAPDRTGLWTFASRSAEPKLDGYRGSFRVVDPPEDAPGGC